MCVHGVYALVLMKLSGVLFANMYIVRSNDKVVELVTDDLAIEPQGDILITVRSLEREKPLYLDMGNVHSKDSVQKKLKELDGLLGTSSFCIALDAIYKYIDAAVQLLKASGAILLSPFL